MSSSSPYTINPYSCKWTQLTEALKRVKTLGSLDEKEVAASTLERIVEMQTQIDAKLQELQQNPTRVSAVGRREALVGSRDALWKVTHSTGRLSSSILTALTADPTQAATAQAEFDSLNHLIQVHDSTKDYSVMCIDLFFQRGKEIPEEKPFHWPIDFTGIDNLGVAPFWRTRTPRDEATLTNRSLFYKSGAYLLATRLFARPPPDLWASGQQDENKLTAITTVLNNWRSGSLTLPPPESLDGQKCLEQLTILRSRHDALHSRHDALNAASKEPVNLEDLAQTYVATLEAAMTYVILFMDYLRVPLDVETSDDSKPVTVFGKFSYSKNRERDPLNLYKYGAVVESPTEVHPFVATTSAATQGHLVADPEQIVSNTVKWESYSSNPNAPSKCYIRIPVKLPRSLCS